MFSLSFYLSLNYGAVKALAELKNPMELYFFNIILILYLVVSLGYLFYLVFENETILKYTRHLTTAVLVLHTLFLGGYLYQTQELNRFDPSFVYILCAWLLAVVYSIYNFKYKLKAVGVLVFPGATIFFFLGYFNLRIQPSPSVLLTSPWASIHIVLSFLSLSVFVLSFILAILFFLQEFQIKHKKFLSVFTRLPSLETMDIIHARAMSAGFLLLTLAIITGAMWAYSVRGVIFYKDPRQLWTIGAWLIYGLFLQGRYSAKWRGRRGMLLSCLGFVIIIFTFVGVRHS